MVNYLHLREKEGNKMKFFRNNPKAFLIIILTFILGTVSFGQESGSATCDAVPGEVLNDLVNQSDLPAVAAQYNLNATPLGEVGSPPTYRMQITNGQTPCDVVALMKTDPRISQKEVNRSVKVEQCR